MSEFENLMQTVSSLWEQHRFEEALVYVDKAISIDPNSPKGWNFKGFLYVLLNQVDGKKQYGLVDASNFFKTALNRDPSFMQARDNLTNVVEQIALGQR